MNHFDLAYLAIAPFFLTSAAYKRWRHGKYRQSLPGMFGANLPKRPLGSHRERVWLHSVSVGETVAAGSVYKLMAAQNPSWQFLNTTTTETGQEQSKRSLPNAHYRDFAPADLSWNVRKFLDAYNPSVYLLLETEIWPNLLLEHGRRKTPVYMVNGKLSERSANGYAKLRSLLHRPLQSVRMFLLQTEADAERYQRITPPGSKIHVTGNVKFDVLPKPLDHSEREAIRRKWGFTAEHLVVVAGSTHPGEERTVFEAFLKARESNPKLSLVIAPRHPERFSAVVEELNGLGAKCWRTSVGPAPVSGPGVIIMDEMGVLARNFGGGDIGLVGGAWNPIGGHNLLEPAAHGIPVVHGPHMHAQKEIMRILNEKKASLSVPEDELHTVLASLAGNAEERRRLGALGQEAARENQGAAQRTVDLIMADLATIRS